MSNSSSVRLRRRSLMLSATAALLLLSPGQAALAQGGVSPAQPLVAGAPDALKQKVQLPNLPEYTGKSRFLNGLVYNNIANNKQGPAYVMCFNAKETGDQVRDWWLNSLRAYRWNITFTSHDVVQGTDSNGSTCIIQISGPVYGYDKDDRSSFVVRFQSGKS